MGLQRRPVPCLQMVSGLHGPRGHLVQRVVEHVARVCGRVFVRMEHARMYITSQLWKITVIPLLHSNIIPEWYCMRSRAIFIML